MQGPVMGCEEAEESRAYGAIFAELLSAEAVAVFELLGFWGELLPCKPGYVLPADSRDARSSTLSTCLT